MARVTTVSACAYSVRIERDSTYEYGIEDITYIYIPVVPINTYYNICAYLLNSFISECLISILSARRKRTAKKKTPRIYTYSHIEPHDYTARGGVCTHYHIVIMQSGPVQCWPTFCGWKRNYIGEQTRCSGRISQWFTNCDYVPLLYTLSRPYTIIYTNGHMFYHSWSIRTEL